MRSQRRGHAQSKSASGFELSEAGVAEAALEAAASPFLLFPGDQRSGPVMPGDLAPVGGEAVQAERPGTAHEGIVHCSLSSSGSPASPSYPTRS